MKKNLFASFISVGLYIGFFVIGCSSGTNYTKPKMERKNSTAPVTIDIAESKERDMHKIFLISDIHVMAPELLEDKNNPKFIEYMKTDPKMLVESPKVLDKLIEQAIAENVGLVLIAGDLTKDGEYDSHDYVSFELERLREAGIKTLVIPGNHDINNPEGVEYKNNGVTENADRTTPEEFEDFYYDFGYNEESEDFENYERDPNSLSYCCEPIDNIYLVCLDTNSYEDIKPEDTRNQTVGKIRDETIEWMTPLVQTAKNDGKQVIVMMHHNLIEHFDGESILESMIMIKDSKKRLQSFFDLNINLVITGHVHSQDVATVYEDSSKKKKITEITCSSPITYPCRYNILTFNNDYTSINFESKQITSIDGMDNYLEVAKNNLQVGEGIIKWTLDEKKSMIDQYASYLMLTGINYDFRQPTSKIAKDIAGCIGDVGTRLTRLYFGGGEDKNTDSEIGRDTLKTDVNTTLNNIAALLIADQQGDSDSQRISNAERRNSLIALVKTYLKSDKLIDSICSDKTSFGEIQENHTDDWNTTISLDD